MKTRNLTVLATVFTIFALNAIGNFFLSRPASAQKDNKITNPANQTYPAQYSDKSKKQVPDRVAYELFLRTVGEYNAKDLVERAGLNAEQTEKIVTEARSLNDLLNYADEATSRVKENKDNLSAPDVKNELAKFEAKKKEYIDRTVGRFLPGSLAADGMNKLKDFIDSEVKNNIQIIPRSKLKKGTEKEVEFVRTSTRSSRQSSGGNLYLYSAAWQNGMDVYGSGTLSEEYTSETSYKVTVTVTSPGGRSNTTAGDWDYATVASESGLSIGVEDGTYSVQANFEQAQGYYDEYKNFITTGSSYVGTANSTIFLLPRVGVRAVRIAPVTGMNTVNTFNAEISADISFDLGFNVNNVQVDLNRLSNPSGVSYTLGIPAGGTVVPNTGNRRVVIASNPGDSTTIRWPVTFENLSPNGTVIESARIDPSQFGTPSPVTVNPEESSTTFNFVRPTPTPTPTPGGGGGGGGTPSGACFCANNSLMAPGDGLGCQDTGISCPAGSTGSGGSCCWYSSPIVLDIDGDGFDMTNYANGVQFDLSGKGWATQTSWTSADSDEAWLTLDRNQSGRIESGLELFGDACEQPAGQNPRNGFSALAVFDLPENGGNGDGKITRRDRVFKKLRLWQDRNHNGLSEAEELFRLPALDVVALFLNYQESRRTDEFGNRFKFRAKVRDKLGARVGRWAWDVFLVISPPGN